MEFVRAITINKPPEEVYGFWRDFRNLPRFMLQFQDVQVIDDRHSQRFIISHRLPFEQAAEGYKIFNHKEDDCLKIVLKTKM